MKREIIKTAKVVIIGVVLSFGVSYVFSGSYWNNAGSNPTGGNVKEVVNIFDSLQTKTGSLNLSNGAGTAKLSADTLEIRNPSYLGAKVDIGKRFVVGGGFGLPESTLDTDLRVTGKIGVNLDEVGLEPTTTIDADGTMKLRPLSQANNAGIIYDAKICADTLGTLMLCDSAFNFSWDVEYVPAIGMSDCTYEKLSLTVVPSAGLSPYNATWSVSAPDAVDGPNMTGSGLSRTVTLFKNDASSYTATVTVDLDDSDPDIAEITKYYIEVVQEKPDGIDGEMCPD